MSAAMLLFAAFLALLIFFASGRSWAFHDGGVGACEGCHTMHNSISYGTTPFPADNTKANPNAQYSEETLNVAGWTGIGWKALAVVNKAGSVGSTPSQYLLRGADPSSTCLNCHEETGHATGGFYVSTAEADMPAGNPPIELTPGGDFGWLKKNYTWGSSYTDPGYLHGHAITAADFYYSAAGAPASAPGGGATPYLTSNLTCISCHDPHGTYRRLTGGGITNSPGSAPIIGTGSYGRTPGNGQAVGVYRLLGGTGYLPLYIADQGGGSAYAFNYPSPAAVAPPVYNQPETGISNQVRVAYGNDATNGGGMSYWCRNCHPEIHTGTGTQPNNYTNNPYSFPGSHPSGTLNSSVPSPSNDQFSNYNYNLSCYNEYIMSGDYNGSSSSSYSSLTPFEEDTLNYATLASHANNNGSYLDGPASSDFVSCMSCHRAHASGWDYGLRFKYNGDSDSNYGFSEIMTDDNGGLSVWPGTDISSPDPNNLVYAMGRTQYETQQAYYGRLAIMFAANQRVLCNKCHEGSASGPARVNGY